MERTKAVLYLMRRREELMKEKGISDIPKEWYELYQKYRDLGEDNSASSTANTDSEEQESSGDPEKLENLEEEDGKTIPLSTKNPIQKLAAEYQLTESKLIEVIEKMEEHTFRQSQVDAYELQMQKNAERLANVGVDINFRETGSATTAAKSIKDDYYPELFGDDGAFEEARQKLIEDIERETRATITEEVEEGPTFLHQTQKADNRILSEQENRAGVRTDKLSRWKFAFKDLSKPKSYPTMIRTRRGGWRQATPLEEATRSWLRNPSLLDKEMYRDDLEKWRDPDEDEYEAALISSRKLERRKALKSNQEG